MKYTKTEERTIFKCDFCENEDKDHMFECYFCDKHICSWHEYNIRASYEHRYQDQERIFCDICPDCKEKLMSIGK